MKTKIVKNVVEFVKKYSPEILMGCGTALVASSVVLAIKKEDNSAKKVAPIVVTAAGGVACFWGAQKIKADRLNAMEGALAVANAKLADALSENVVFHFYRENIKKELGIKKEQKIYDKSLKQAGDEAAAVIQGCVSKDIDDENRETLDVDYLFDELNSYYSSAPFDNYNYLQLVERTCQNQLQRDGYLFLNDLLPKIGFKKCKAGQFAGWVYNHNIQEHVDLGFDYFLAENSENGDKAFEYNQRKLAFLEGYEKSVMLHINCRPNVTNEVFGDEQEAQERIDS